jgi:Tol biopolymer transport system component
MMGLGRLRRPIRSSAELVVACALTATSLVVAASPAHAAHRDATNGTLVFADAHHTHTALFLVDLPTTTPSLFVHARHADLSLPSWSPDGGTIAAVRHSVSPQGHDRYTVKLIDVATKTRRRLTDPVKQPIQSIDWSPTGDQLLISRGKAGLFTVDADGSNLTRISSAPAGQASWSPAGDEIAYADYAASTPDNTLIHIITAAGQPIGTVAAPDSPPYDWDFDRAPFWSSDGQAIYFTSATLEGSDRTYDLDSVQTDGSDRVDTGLPGYGTVLTGSDGSYVYLNAVVSQQCICVDHYEPEWVDATGEQHTIATRGSEFDWTAAPLAQVS